MALSGAKSDGVVTTPRKNGPPECYEEVAEAIENALANGNAEILDWSDLQLAEEIYWCAGIDENHAREDIERSIRIYRERNAK